MYEASRARLCFPLPPTPMSMALPLGLVMMRAMRQMCSIACSKRTSSIATILSLYSARKSSSTLWEEAAQCEFTVSGHSVIYFIINMFQCKCFAPYTEYSY